MKRAISRKNLWDGAPRVIKTAVGMALRAVPVEWLLGKHFRENFAFVHDAQWWPADRAKEYQLNRLRQILKLAYEKTTFYRHVFDSVGFCPGDLKSLGYMERLPTIDKSVVVEHLQEMCTKRTDEGDVDYVSTGGTSGQPLRFYINGNRSSVEYAYLTAGWERAGYHLGMPMAVLRGRVVKPNRRGVYHEYDPLLRHHYYSNFHMTDDNMAQYLDDVRRTGPCVLHAYPSAAYTLAQFMLATGRCSPGNILAVLLESENVLPDQVDAIERALGAKTFSSYGHSEKCVLAAQCELSRDYHVWPTYGYCELLDEHGLPVRTVGQGGEIVGTGFINTVVPFIRYRTGDYATYVGERCEACGREHTIIRNVKGRWPQGGLVANDGSIVNMTTLNVHDDTFADVRDYQFHQSVPGRAVLRVVPSRPLDEEERRRIVTNMNKRLQGQVMLTIEIARELVKTSRGKQPRVIQTCAASTAGSTEAEGAR